MRHDQTHDSATLTVDSIDRSEVRGSTTLVVGTKPRAIDARCPSTSATTRLRAHAYSGYSRYGQVQAQAKPRRRLRREIRWVGMAVLSVLPFLFAVVLLRGSAANAEPTTVLPYAISITVEPTSPVLESATAVVLPGYLLPDDGSEDVHDAGD